ncbi:hypothetical protein ANCDUO_03661 [Ancylostoma duodenale]|uniref:CUB domain-containing protein n=1 Tax=Ancylostoma duodenale TaxID=51022 RepID=A0A0C2H8Z3_9BILA|nr:hypothetical protein ANCDUO_03661 [Ancylostoma duodenale]
MSCKNSLPTKALQLRMRKLSNRLRCSGHVAEKVESDWLKFRVIGFCSNVPVPPCRQPGYQDPRNCYSCKCPRIFGGQYCEQLPVGSAPNCNGDVLQATSSSWMTLQGVAGDPNSYAPQTAVTDCFWHITAPAGRRIQLRLSSPPGQCMEGCPWQSIEINLGQFDLYGMM